MSTNVKIYASVPYTISTEDNIRILESIKDIVPDNTCVSITQHDRTEVYTRRVLDEATIVVIKHQSNAFKFNSAYLSVGVQKELLYAIQHNKPIVLSYKTATGEDRLYKAKLTASVNGTYDVEGMPGTVGDIVRLISLKSKVDSKSKDLINETFGLSNITTKVVDIRHENELNLPLLLL